MAMGSLQRFHERSIDPWLSVRPAHQRISPSGKGSVGPSQCPPTPARAEFPSFTLDVRLRPRVDASSL